MGRAGRSGTEARRRSNDGRPDDDRRPDAHGGRVEDRERRRVHPQRDHPELPKPGGELKRLADGLEADPNASFNTIGVLQGNGVELDTWCAKLGFARDTLKLFKQAMGVSQAD